MELKANEFSQEIIKDLCSSITIRLYICFCIAKRLNCKISELRILDSLSPSDREGWFIESYFPIGSEIKQTLLHGELIEVEYKGKKLIADKNITPMIMYICERDIV